MINKIRRETFLKKEIFKKSVVAKTIKKFDTNQAVENTMTTFKDGLVYHSVCWFFIAIGLIQPLTLLCLFPPLKTLNSYSFFRQLY